MAGEEEPPIVHVPTLWEQIDGDRDLLADVAALFREDCPRRLEECRTALESRDSERLGRAAHSIKGAASTLAAQATFHAAYALEKIGHAGRFDEAPPAIEKLDLELQRLFDMLDRIEEWAPS